MKKVTIGKKYNVGAIRSIYYEKNECFDGKRQIDECYLLILITEGSAVFKINELKILVSAPCLICLNEKELINLIEERNIIAESIYVHPIFLNKTLNFEDMRDFASSYIADNHDRFLFSVFVNRDNDNNGIIHLDPITVMRVKELFSQAGKELLIQRDWYWSCRCRSYFMELLFVLERLDFKMVGESFTLNNSIVFSKEFSDIQKVLLYIHNNYQKKICVQDMVGIFNTNRTTLSKRFKKTTNHTISEYVNLYRIKIAKLMLTRTNLNIGEIANRLGFGDNTHFIRVFKKHVQLTPLQFRKKLL